jgi:lipid II isoglutaminyl synthase (glutamine-hydrolysing)
LASYDGRAVFEAKVAVALAARRLERLRRRGNVAVPGHVLLRAEPRALARLAGRLAGGAVAVSATAGKTTTTAMLASIAREAGLHPVTNPSGANMPPGLVAELLAASRAGRGTAGDVGIFEVDERWLPRVADDLGVRVMVLGNVLRDHVDRMGDLDGVARMWQAMITASGPDLRLAVNADDPRLAPLAELRPGSVRFGIEDPAIGPGPQLGAVDPPPCATCGADLTYEPAYLAHLGRWRCPACGRGRPSPDVSAEEVALAGTGGASFTLRLPTGRRTVRLGVGGLHNVCNAVAAAAGAVAMGLPPDAVVAGLEATTPAWARGEVVAVDGVDVVLHLLKGGPGGAALLRTLLEEEGPLDLLLAVHLLPNDPADCPYLWDIDLAALLPRLRQVVCSGNQAALLATWLKYSGADMDVVAVEPPLEAGLRRALAAGTGRLHVVGRHTAVQELRDVLTDAGHVAPVW